MIKLTRILRCFLIAAVVSSAVRIIAQQYSTAWGVNGQKSNTTLGKFGVGRPLISSDKWGIGNEQFGETWKSPDSTVLLNENKENKALSISNPHVTQPLAKNSMALNKNSSNRKTSVKNIKRSRYVGRPINNTQRQGARNNDKALPTNAGAMKPKGKSKKSIATDEY